MSIDDIVGIVAIVVLITSCISFWRKLQVLKKETQALEEELERLMKE